VFGVPILLAGPGDAVSGGEEGVIDPTIAGADQRGPSAAALALVAVTLVRLMPSDVHRDSTLVARSSAISLESPLASEALLVSQALTGLFQEVRSEYVQLSQETARAFEDWDKLPETQKWLLPIPRADSSNETPSSTWMRLDRPVSERVGQAFDFLWDALPGSAQQSS
jgi:hypothetical protein